MNPQLQAQLGVLFEREGRDAHRDRRGHAEARRLQDVGARLRRTSSFTGDPFGVVHVGIIVEPVPPTTRNLSGWVTADPPLQPPPKPPERPIIPWGPIKPTSPPPKPAPPCPKC